MKRHDHSNSHEVNHSVGAGSQFQRYIISLSWWEGWQLVGNTKETVCHTRQSLSIQDLKACLPSDIVPLIMPHLHIVPFPMGRHLNTRVCGGHSYSNHHRPFLLYLWTIHDPVNLLKIFWLFTQYHIYVLQRLGWLNPVSVYVTWFLWLFNKVFKVQWCVALNVALYKLHIKKLVYIFV